VATVPLNRYVKRPVVKRRQIVGVKDVKRVNRIAPVKVQDAKRVSRWRTVTLTVIAAETMHRAKKGDNA
jgi:hypothetical protein